MIARNPLVSATESPLTRLSEPADNSMLSADLWKHYFLELLHYPAVHYSSFLEKKMNVGAALKTIQLLHTLSFQFLN